MTALAFLYAALMLTYWRAWRALPEQKISADWQPTERLTVIIPARNEASNIGACLRSILTGSYPANLLEIIVVDDFSEDDTVDKVQRVQAEILAEQSPVSLRLLCLADVESVAHLGGVPHLDTPAFATFSPKKNAITLAVAQARSEIIVTTDADCIVPPDWLRCIAAAMGEPGRVLLTGPVAIHREQGLLQHFQALDVAGMMGITGAGLHLGWQRMGNGANLAYQKSVFEEVGGYAGNEQVASGDDMFLMQKVAARYPEGVFFLKNPAATVLTEAQPTWAVLWQQRLRWGSKNAALPEWPVRLALLTVFLFCWCILLNAGMLMWRLLEAPSEAVQLAALLLFSLSVKAAFDFLLLREMCRWLGRREWLRWFWPSFFLHIAYVAGVGAASVFFKKYEWKGRVNDER